MNDDLASSRRIAAVAGPSSWRSACTSAAAWAPWPSAMRSRACRPTRDPRGRRSWFRYTEAAAWLLAAVHLRGMAEGRQPWSENAEIPGWAALAVGARRFAPPSESGTAA